jgi:hypothetical protein
MRERAAFVRCNAVFYGPLDFDDVGPAFGMNPDDAREFSARRLLELHGASIPPMLVVKAGRERNAGINESIDRFAAAAARRGARVQVLTHPTGIHAFDVLQPGARSRALIRRALAFMKSRLNAPTVVVARRPPPLRLQQRCVTRAERRRVVRFAAVDGVRLIGVLLGSGPRAVVLAHQGGGGGANLCIWMPYTRSLARPGYRVLAFDNPQPRLFRPGEQRLPPHARRFRRARCNPAAASPRRASDRPGRGLTGRRRTICTLPFSTSPPTATRAFPKPHKALYDATPLGDKQIWSSRARGTERPFFATLAVKEFVDGWIRDRLPAAGGVRLAGIEFSGLPATAPRGAK